MNTNTTADAILYSDINPTVRQAAIDILAASNNDDDVIAGIRQRVASGRLTTTEADMLADWFGVDLRPANLVEIEVEGEAYTVEPELWLDLRANLGDPNLFATLLATGLQARTAAAADPNVAARVCSAVFDRHTLPWTTRAPKVRRAPRSIPEHLCTCSTKWAEGARVGGWLICSRPACGGRIG